MKWRSSVAVLMMLPAWLAAAGGSGVEEASQSIEASRIKARIAFLADDLLEGRGTGERGSEIAARFIATEFADDRLRPGVDASRGDFEGYFQKLTLVGVTTDSDRTSLSIGPRGDEVALQNGSNAVLATRRQKPSIDIEAPMAFVGYGITAPEYDWDDYRGFNAEGKVVVCLVNEPSSRDARFFGGAALTYYGRWSYKLENAERHHALGVILIHTRESAGYPWQVVQSSWTGEQAQLPVEPGQYRLALAAWMMKDTAVDFLRKNGLELGDVETRAGKRGFSAIPLPKSFAEGTLASRLRRFTTENVAGVLPGSDAGRRDQFVVLTAHFDHLGIGKPDSRGDRIYNGAVDNASGVATLLEIARAASDGRWRPPRSILFLCVTAEEQGLLGSADYVQHPLVPLEQTAADLNMDGTSVHGELAAYCLLGIDRTDLEPEALAIARSMNLALVPDPHPGQGSYYRSDQFSFARAGVPAVSVRLSTLYRGHDAAWGERIFEDYTEHRYHQPSDQYDPSWDLSGSAQEAQLVLRLADAIARAPQMPNWKPGGEFSRGQ
jgi:Zn-dependent M28 family amino/carboxypeptidase